MKLLLRLCPLTDSLIEAAGELFRRRTKSVPIRHKNHQKSKKSKKFENFSQKVYPLGLVQVLYIIEGQETGVITDNLQTQAAALEFPPPPNKGGKGTQVTSKTLYNKGGKNGYRIDVENPGNRPGQIHLQKDGVKYYYNIKSQTFRIGSSSRKMAPKAIQELLNEPKVVKAIGKGLKILGY